VLSRLCDPCDPCVFWCLDQLLASTSTFFATPRVLFSFLLGLGVLDVWIHTSMAPFCLTNFGLHDFRLGNPVSVAFSDFRSYSIGLLTTLTQLPGQRQYCVIRPLGTTVLRPGLQGNEYTSLQRYYVPLLTLGNDNTATRMTGQQQ